MNAKETRAILQDEASKHGFRLVWSSARRCTAHLQRVGSSEVRLVDWSYRSPEDTIRCMVRISIQCGQRLDQLPTSKYFAGA